MDTPAGDHPVRGTRGAAEALEARWQVAQSETNRLRASLVGVREILRTFDNKILALRRSRDASQVSLNLTRQAACRCGLENSPVTRITLERFEAAIAKYRAAVLSLIQEAEPACEEFNSLYTHFREARRAEREALDQLVQLREAHRVSVAAEPSSPKIKHAKERLALLDRLEEEDRKREKSLPDDPHYDPDYSDWEILMRRSRPWV